MPDRKGRLTPDEIREAGRRAMGLSGGSGVPSKKQIDQSLKMMRSPMPAYQEGGVTGSQFPPATELQSVEAVPGAQPRSEEDIRREIIMELQRDNPGMELAGSTDPRAMDHTLRHVYSPLSPTGFVEENPRPPEGPLGGAYAGFDGKSDRGNPVVTGGGMSQDPTPRMGSFLESQADVELMGAMDPGELPQERPRGMEQQGEAELQIAHRAMALRMSDATRRMAEPGISREQSMQAQMDRQQATEEMALIQEEMDRRASGIEPRLFRYLRDGTFYEMAEQEISREQSMQEEMDRRGVGAAHAASGGFYDTSFDEDVSRYRRELLGEGMGAEPARAPAPAAGGGDTSRFMERDPIMAYRGGGMAGMKKHMASYGHGGMAGSKKK